jgi:hypothetical protein
MAGCEQGYFYLQPPISQGSAVAKNWRNYCTPRGVSSLFWIRRTVLLLLGASNRNDKYRLHRRIWTLLGRKEENLEESVNLIDRDLTGARPLRTCQPYWINLLRLWE